MVSFPSMGQIAAAVGIPIVLAGGSEQASAKPITPPELTSTQDPGTRANASRAEVAQRVAQCVFRHGDRTPFSELMDELEQPELAQLPGQVATLVVRNRSRIYVAVAADMGHPSIPDLLVLDGFYGPHSLVDFGLDGNVNAGITHGMQGALEENAVDPNPFNNLGDGAEGSIHQPTYQASLATSLQQMDEVCRANETEQPRSFYASHCPTEDMGLMKLSQLHAQVVPSIARLHGENEVHGTAYECSGFAFGPDGAGLFATARHCLGQLDGSDTEIMVEWPAQLSERGEITQLYRTQGEIVDYNTTATKDVAIIAVNQAVPTYPLEPNTHPEGLPSALFGNPLGASWRLAGSTTPAHLNYTPEMKYQIELNVDPHCNAAAGPGNSGGPNVDSAGKVLGTVWAGIHGDEELMTYSVPIQTTMTLLASVPPIRLGGIQWEVSKRPVEICGVKQENVLLSLSGWQRSTVADEATCRPWTQ